MAQLEELNETVVAAAEAEFWGNPLWAWVASAVVVAAGFVVLRLIVALLRSRTRGLRERVDRLPTRILEMLAKNISITTVIGLALVAGVMTLELSEKAAWAARIGVVAIVFLQIGAWGRGVIDLGLAEFLRRREHSDKEVTREQMRARLGVVRFAAFLVLYTLLLLTALQTLGVDVTALIAGLGIGGIAVALAVQNILGDLFASLSILVDKPFEVGDFIISGEQLGTVESIGMKTTRIRALSGEQLVISNSDLLSSRIQNFKRMQERRKVFQVGVLYQTTPEQLRAIPAIIRGAVASQKLVRFDRAHLFRFGDSSYDFEAVYWILSPDYNTHMDIHQDVMLRVIEAFKREGIEFAYPTRTLFIEKLGKRDDGEAGTQDAAGGGRFAEDQVRGAPGGRG